MFRKLSIVLVSIALFGCFSWAQNGNSIQLQPDSLTQSKAGLYQNSAAANYGPPRPYEYGYQLDDTNGSHGHIEKRDESGRVEGEYSINLGDGRVRVVKYVADENGYRADVSTDELGTESKNPNDVYIGSTAISGHDAALKYGPFAPPHVEQPLIVAERPQIQTINSQASGIADLWNLCCP
ncbi:hypothetical protein BIW11_00449 [Tropilaelaps mercedesae]|uniref:Cuticle protein 10.9-like n=1 Tax=Tropilaelaps mercedesae TaxID=418985 RepID=A0A1V9XV62_9ACAR|nr:hypothetical protein BIW11_00449 [Tropilaelaps mercedesae]